ncbi:MAG: carboxyl transferase domain-containing protein, partial [Salinibacter sp.]
MSESEDASATHRELYEGLQRRRAEAAKGGGEARIERQHEKDKLTARERLDILLDDDSFEELGTFVRHQETNFDLDENRPPGDGVVTGYGTIHGRLVYVFSQDFTVYGGSLGRA